MVGWMEASKEGEKVDLKQNLGQKLETSPRRSYRRRIDNKRKVVGPIRTVGRKEIARLLI